MKRGCAVACLVWGITGLGVSTGVAVTMNFNDLPNGTQYGGAFGNSPGQFVYSQDRINMSVENFTLGSSTAFNVAEVGGQYAHLFPTPSLALDNISVLFDFSELAFDVTMVTLDFQDIAGIVGGTNLSANGATLFDLTDLPVGLALGVTAAIDGSQIVLTGDIDRFLIGGQELVIDNIVAIPEPTSLVLLGLVGIASCLRRPFRSPASNPRA